MSTVLVHNNIINRPSAIAGLSGRSAVINQPITVSNQTFAFVSDWSTATGQSDSARRDTGKTKPWPHDVSGGGGTVVAATGSIMPNGMTNCFQRKVGGPTGGSGDVNILPADGYFSAPSVGQTLYFRLYVRNEVANSEGDCISSYNAQHPVESGTGAAASNWEFRMGAVGTTAGGFPLSFVTNGNPIANPSSPDNLATASWLLGGNSNNWTNFYLDKFHTYRIEWAFTKQSTNVYTPDMRVYNSSDVLIYDKTNIFAQGNSSYTLATNGPLGISIDDATIGGLLVGTNQNWVSNGNPLVAAQFIYYGGVAVSTTDWCGPYVAGEHT